MGVGQVNLEEKIIVFLFILRILIGDSSGSSR